MNSIRRKHYDWFLHLHLVCVALGYVGALLHSVSFRWLLLVPGVLYAVDYLLRRLLNPWLKFGGAILPATIASQAEDNPGAGAGAVVAAGPGSGAGSGAAPVTAVHSSRLCGNRLHASIVSLECFGSGEAASLNERVLVLTLRVARDFPCGADPLHPEFPAGSWLMLRVPEISHLQTHPFTISSCRTSSADATATILTLHIQAVSPPGDRARQAQLERTVRREVAIDQPSLERTWTQQLYERSKRAMGKHREKISFGAEADLEGGNGGASSASGQNLKPPFSLYLDGPYLSVCMPLLRYRVLVLVAGGIGVTPVMSLLEDFMLRLSQAQAAGCDRPEEALAALPSRIYVAWTARSANAFQKWFPRQMAAIARCPRIRMQLYSTHPNFDADRLAAGYSDAPQQAFPSSSSSSAAISVKAGGGVYVPGAQVSNGSLELVSALPVPVAARPGASFSFADDEEEAEEEKSPHGVPSAVVSDRVRSGSAVTAIMVQPRGAEERSVALDGPPQPVVLLSGRPDFSALLDSVSRDLAGLPTPAHAHNVLVMSCGPDRMVEDAEAEAERRGMQFVHEAFNY